jgi:hypothetical protein
MGSDPGPERLGFRRDEISVANHARDKAALGDLMEAPAKGRHAG